MLAVYVDAALRSSCYFNQRWRPAVVSTTCLGRNRLQASPIRQQKNSLKAEMQHTWYWCHTLTAERYDSETNRGKNGFRTTSSRSVKNVNRTVRSSSDVVTLPNRPVDWTQFMNWMDSVNEGGVALASPSIYSQHLHLL